MAFVEFPLAPATGLVRPAVRAPEALLSPIERQVLALARGDSLASLRTASVVARLLEALFGVKRANLLADPRLEAMRRLAVAARRRSPRGIAREAKLFLASGYQACHATAVLSLATAS